MMKSLISKPGKELVLAFLAPLAQAIILIQLAQVQTMLRSLKYPKIRKENKLWKLTVRFNTLFLQARVTYHDGFNKTQNLNVA